MPFWSGFALHQIRMTYMWVLVLPSMQKKLWLWQRDGSGPGHEWPSGCRCHVQKYVSALLTLLILREILHQLYA